MDIKCVRCGKKIPEKHYLIQSIIYLGKSSKRLNICKECYDSFIDWLEEFDGGDTDE